MAVSINDALDLIYKTTEPITRLEVVNTLDSNDRIVAKDIYTTKSLPRFNNSAMDGYAIKLSSSGETVACEDKILYAGTKEIPILGDSKTIKIMTGAPIPIDCEAVVPFEDVILDYNNNMVTFPNNIKLNANIRMSGEELENGEKCLTMGETINSYTIGLLASQGMSIIEVIEKPKVTIISSGDELVDFNKSDIGEYELYNSNSPMFYTRSTELGCDTNILNHFGDSMQEFKSQILNVAQNSDIIITSGGASNGDKDLTKEAFLNAGMKMIFDKIEIKPGKPTAIGKINNTFVVILPGNPLAAMVNFEIFIVPLISKLRGNNMFYHQAIEAKLADDINIKAGKNTVILGSSNENIFYPLKKQSPNMVSVLKDADALLITTPEISNIKNGESIKIIKLKNKMSDKKMESIFYK
jgi:molybdopterin molybdotransferase